MKYYFTLISNDYRIDKNKLETAAKDATREASYRLISQEELPNFKKEFIRKIKDLNTKHPRCKPLEPYNFQYHIDNEKSAICVGEICDLLFYEAKNEL